MTPQAPHASYVARRMYEIAANPTPEALADLRQLAAMVGRMEATLDDILDHARAQDEALSRKFGL